MLQQWYMFLYDLDLNNSSLLIAEYLHKKHGSFDSLKYVILNLYKLNCQERILDIMEKENKCLEDIELRIIFYKCSIKNENTISCNMLNNNSISNCKSANNYDNLKFNADFYKSVEMFWKALTKSDINRRNLLIESYKIYSYNIEPLYFLILEELINDVELINLIDLNPYKEVLKEIFTVKYNSEFYHPFYIFLYSKYLYVEEDEFKLFNLSHSSYKLYKHSIFTYLSLGLYFIFKKQYKEAKKILLIWISKNTTDLFIIYLYLGICYSKLRECENSISCFNICNKKMNCTWKSYYYLAYEYLKMTNIEKSKFFYKEGLNVDNNIKIQEGYIILLIYCEDYKEALLYLSNTEHNKTANNDMYKNLKIENTYLNYAFNYTNENLNNNFNLLRCYCNLFLGNINESKKYLNLCLKDYRYYCTLGYIEHLTDNIDNACDAYNKSLLLKESSVVNNLINSAFERDKENDVYNSCTEIFEFLFINNMEIEVI
ncbi:component of the 20s cyclosome anaphase-promoting complex [Vairimorpha apis BRL 01]|uniref:Component of the 20s cyclosome anaphase-promoting complex n=1 Tax=Vairimorpha apis BRL 01 TaxID=1037528 RepID=T0L3F4_9MICR|nr:component of the 20s cyclosome anaphase-promoting complex [Vairimorpha apis BRL 01]